MSNTTERRAIEDVLSEWANEPTRKVTSIDESRRRTGQGEMVAYCCVIMTAGDALAFLHDASAAREFLPEGSCEEGFKGRNFREYMKVPEFKRFLDVVGAAYGCHAQKIIRVITTLPYIQAAPKSRIHVESSDRAAGKKTVRGVELGVLLSFVSRLAVELGLESTRFDVVVDRSAQFGTDPNTRGLVNEFEALRGPIGNAQDVSLIFDSDQGPLKDLLLLPDFWGYVTLNVSPKPQFWTDAEAEVLSGKIPFRLVDDSGLLPLIRASASKG